MRKKLDVQKLIEIHYVTTGDCKGWVHTHGLARYGRPELEIRKVPALFATSAAHMLNEIAEYLLESRKPMLPGHTMELGRDMLLMLEGKPDAEHGYDELHYRVPVLTVTAIERACEYCAPKFRA
jgi:hypothetical protein